MNTFQELELIAPVQRALAAENYQTPTGIQQQTIPPALEGRDVLGCAQTGTGKTAAFALPIINLLGRRTARAVPNRPRAVILAPTRELALQIDQSFSRYGQFLKLKRALVYGGISQQSQVRMLKRGVHILVATPGRMLDLMNQGHIRLDQLEVFVLDEADRMLDMGFLPDLKRIIRCFPEDRQSLFFSATLPPKIVELAKQMLRNPVRVNVSPKRACVRKIDQSVVFVDRKRKPAALKAVLQGEDVDQALVFSRTKRGANQIVERLAKNGIAATAIHGNKTQNARQRALKSFRNKQFRVLVATDVASRGIDISGISHVVNYDIPVEPESYVHRIGRTGRAGASGTAISFCSTSETSDLKAIESLIGNRIRRSQDFCDALPEEPAERSQPGTPKRPSRRRSGNGKPVSPAGRARSGGRFKAAKSAGKKNGQNGRRAGSRSRRRVKASGRPAVTAR